MLFTEPAFLFLFLPVLLGLYFVTFSREHASYANWLLRSPSRFFVVSSAISFHLLDR